MQGWFVLRLIDRNLYRICTRHGMTLFGVRSMEAWSGICILSCFLFNFDLVIFPTLPTSYSSFHWCRDLLVSFRRATGQKPLRIIFYRWMYNLVYHYICIQIIYYVSRYINTYTNARLHARRVKTRYSGACTNAYMHTHISSISIS